MPMATPILRQLRCPHLPLVVALTAVRRHEEGGAADQYIPTWVASPWPNSAGYSDWAKDLANHEKGGLDMNSTTPNNDGDGVRVGRPAQLRPAPTKN